MTTIDQNCIIVDDMAVCMRPTSHCQWHRLWTISSDCMYNFNGHCHHCLAIANAVKDGRIYMLVKKENKHD